MDTAWKFYLEKTRAADRLLAVLFRSISTKESSRRKLKTGFVMLSVWCQGFKSGLNLEEKFFQELRNARICGDQGMVVRALAPWWR